MTKIEKHERWIAANERARFSKYGPKKTGVFSSIDLKMQLKKRVKAEKEKILKPLSRYIRSISQTLDPNFLFEQVEQYMTVSNQISCKMKGSFSMEEAAAAQQLEDKELTPYICRACGFVHFGHDPVILSLQSQQQVQHFEEVTA